MALNVCYGSKSINFVSDMTAIYEVKDLIVSFITVT